MNVSRSVSTGGRDVDTHGKILDYESEQNKFSPVNIGYTYERSGALHVRQQVPERDFRRYPGADMECPLKWATVMDNRDSIIRVDDRKESEESEVC